MDLPPQSFTPRSIGAVSSKLEGAVSSVSADETRTAMARMKQPKIFKTNHFTILYDKKK